MFVDQNSIPLTPQAITDAVQKFLDGRLAQVVPSEDWSWCEARFSWCGDLFDFLVEGLEDHTRSLGFRFEDPFPGPIRLWDEDQQADGEHLRRFWTTAVDISTGRPLAKLCTVFSHRHDRVALPRPPKVRAFSPVLAPDSGERDL